MAEKLDVYRRGITPRTIDELFDDMQRSFEQWMRPFFDSTRVPFFGFDTDLGRIPSADIEETDKEYIVTAEMPGIPKENIEVKINEDNVLEIRGKSTSERKESKGRYIRHERSASDYYRSIELDTPIDVDKVEARVDNGVLTLRLPKKENESKNVKRIEIK